MLHFQASDWETSVYVNGGKVGQHRGGYDPFSFDITDYLTDSRNQLHVCVWDATESQSQAIGKQIMPENRQGNRYQPTGGIWQTVWLEPVPDNTIQSMRIIPDYDNSLVKLEVTPSNAQATVKVQVFDDRKLVAENGGMTGNLISIPLENFKSWSPGDPFLYTMNVALEEEGMEGDRVNSYFGMRKVEVKTATDGYKRIFLYDEPVFQYGPLDQGYWPDGVLTPPSEDAIKFDLEYLKKIRCNMIRVHIKSHPDRWYSWADKLGLLVWQDMICMPKYGQTVDTLAAEQWCLEFQAMVNCLYNHPSIISWIIFNEGWSQHRTEFYADWISEYDPGRIINATSGGGDKPVGDVMDVHDYSFYPKNNANDYKLNGKRALMIGEASGISLAIPGHTWYSETNPPKQERHNNFTPVDNYSIHEDGSWHTYGTPEVFEEAYKKFIETVRCLNTGSACNALVYTQITDVEHELDGYLTYDREISKIDPEVMRKVNMTLYDPPELKPVLPFSSKWKIDIKGSPLKTVALPVGETNDFIAVGTEAVSPYVIENKFIVDDSHGKLVVAVRGFTDSEISLNGQLFRETRLHGYGEPGINFYPVYQEEMEWIKAGENNITVRATGSNNIDLLDVAVYVYDE